MDKIQSKDNNLVKKIKKLKEKKYREESKCFLIEGFRFVEEALISSWELQYIFILDKALDKWNIICSKLNINPEKGIIITEQVLKIISNTDNPQGIVAVVEYKDMEIKNGDGTYILVDKIQDPGNMGTIIRTAHAVGALGVIVTKGSVDIYNDKTLRSTMGSIFNIPVIEDKDLSIVKSLKNQGFKLIASHLDETSEDFYKLTLPRKLILAVGNEGSGLDEDIVDISCVKAKIPMPGGAESLNAAVAASIMLYEDLRQKRCVIGMK